jgi:hypothetical protein
VLAGHFGVPVERGPDEIVDLPVFLGLAGRKVEEDRQIDDLVGPALHRHAEMPGQHGGIGPAAPGQSRMPA